MLFLTDESDVNNERHQLKREQESDREGFKILIITQVISKYSSDTFHSTMMDPFVRLSLESLSSV